MTQKNGRETTVVRSSLRILYRSLALINAKDNARVRGPGPSITIIDSRLPTR